VVFPLKNIILKSTKVFNKAKQLSTAPPIYSIISPGNSTTGRVEKRRRRVKKIFAVVEMICHSRRIGQILHHIILTRKYMKNAFTAFGRNWFNAPAARPARGLDIVRVAIALVLSVHAIHGLAFPANLTGFGQYLGSLGFPFGVVLAWALMFVQIGSSIALVLNRFVVAACIAHITILVTGIILIHAENGWFVVGAGRNGVEYSVTLITCLGAVLWAYWPKRQAD
jgi:putative oxidoreductase